MAQAPPGRRTVRINMDETPIKMDPVRKCKGLIAVPKAELKRKSASMVRPASLALRRSVITLVAFVCDDDAVQKQLPQIIVGNHRLLPKKAAALHRTRQDSVYVLSRKSGWNNAKLQCEIMRLLGRLLAPMQALHWFILSLDAHSCHIAPCVFEAAHRAGVSLMVLPASMTDLLQPLDTHVFCRLKFELWRESQALLLASDRGEFDAIAFLEMACRVVGVVFGQSHRGAFESCGFSDTRLGRGDRVLTALEWTGWPVVGSELPTLAELQHLWPERREIPIVSLFRGLLTKENHTGEPCAAHLPTDLEPCPPSPPLALRLRSASKLKKATPPAPVEASAVPGSIPDSPAAPAPVPCRPMDATPTTTQSFHRRLPVGRPLLQHRSQSRMALAGSRSVE